MRFRKWLENWDQQKNHQLNGEYWITDDGSTMYADGDIGDYNHEAYVMMYLQDNITSDFNVHEESEFTDWEEIKKLIVQEILNDEDMKSREELQYRVDDGEIDEIIVEKMKETDPEAEEKMAIANGYGDAREYAIIKWGWKRVAGNNIESRSLNAHDMQAISSGLNEIDEMLADDAEFSISVYGDQNYDVTLAELEAGRLKSYEPETPEQGFSVGQSDLGQGWEQKRRQQEKWIDIQKNSASKQVKDMDLKNMHPYYQNKKFPFGDWNTNSFQNWILMKEEIQITHIDPEDDWELGDQAYQIAKMTNIRPDSSKNPTIVALDDEGNVIGAVFTSWHNDDDASEMAGEPVSQFSFDVVVHPKWQGHEQVGVKLIKQAEQEKTNLEGMYGQKAFIRTWVVNPKLFRVMTNRWGYQPDSDWRYGGVHVTKYD